ncbi:hypothetical protein [Halorubrum sp.]
MVDGTVFAGGSDDNVYAPDAETGDREWAFDTATPLQHRP